MTGDLGQQPNADQPAPAFDFAALPTPTIANKKRVALRDRSRRLTVLAVLFVGGAIAVWAWANRSPDRDVLNLPRVTVEVRGMT